MEEVVKKPVSSLKKVSQERIDQVLKLYNEGYSQNHIASTLRMTCRTAQAILEKYGEKRTKFEQSYYYHKTSTLREDAFDVLTDESAYWLGFMYADGYITNPEKRFSIGVLLKGEDEGHLLKFKEFLQAPQTLKYGKAKLEGYDKEYTNVRIMIGSQRLHSKLRDWGITWTKSYDAKPPEAVKYNRHFWRGVVDGDGYLGLINDKSRTKPRKRMHLCGTIDMINGFKEFLIKSGINTTYEVKKARNTLYKIEVSSIMAKEAAKVLYEGSKDYLERKFQKYKEMIAEDINFTPEPKI